jgi:hypothetical protein
MPQRARKHPRRPADEVAMTLWKILKDRFQHEDDGAVTVDWVVVTAAVAFLSVSLLSSIKSSVQTGTDSIASRTEDAVD